MTTGTALVFKKDGVRVVGPLHQSLACAVHASLLEGAVYGIATAELFDEPVAAVTLLQRSALTAEAGKGEFQDWFDSWAKTRDLNLHRIEDGRLLAPTSSVAEDAFLSGCMIASIHYMELCRQEQNLALSTAAPAGEWVTDEVAADVLTRYLANSPSGDHWPPERARDLRIASMRDAIRNALAASPRGASAGAES
jgi:hypothetical protein